MSHPDRLFHISHSWIYVCDLILVIHVEDEVEEESDVEELSYHPNTSQGSINDHSSSKVDEVDEYSADSTLQESLLTNSHHQQERKSEVTVSESNDYDDSYEEEYEEEDEEEDDARDAGN